jgi:hypothetical protein
VFEQRRESFFGSQLKHVKTIKKDGDDWMNGYVGYLKYFH